MTARALLLIGLLANPPLVAAADADYERDIRPLLATKCVSCHGPVKQEAGLRLDAGVLVRKGGENGKIASPDAPNESLLLRRVTAESADERMPPPSEGEPLTAEQVNLLRDWIAAGLPSPENEPVLAGAQDHWAYRPIVKPPLPESDGAGQGVHPIDQLLATHHHNLKLQPLPPADALTLLRRVTFDLTGLPPSLAEQDRFVADSSPESYASLVDELLARPQHGERWARHWMDVWRYSDWDGYKAELRGSQRHIWRWRDWIVESLNANRPYDRMVVEMLAGDELAPADPDTLRATGFLARNFHKSNRNIWLDATVEHTAKGFLGLTLNCARCHDHKYDPIDQAEYFAFRAIFEPHQVRTDRLPGQADLMKDGLPRAYDADLAAATYVFLRGDEKHPDKEHPAEPAVPKMFDRPLEIAAVELPDVASFPSLAEYIEREEIAAAEKRLAAAKSEWAKVSAAQLSHSPSGGGQPPDATRAASATGKRSNSTTGIRPPSPSTPITLEPAIESVRRQLVAAERECTSLRARWAADRAKHSRNGSHTDAELAALAANAASAERSFGVAAAEREIFVSLLKLRAAHLESAKDAGKRVEAITKAAEGLTKSNDALAKARENAATSDANYSSVGTVYPTTSTGRRLALAEWIVDPRNPLTARVAVNHVWLHHFGRPLVDNVFDFGLRTPPPPLVDVLDWLAAELIDSGWDLRRLHRLIVTSQAYQRASSAETSLLAHNAALDPDNLTWWRADARRLEAEVIRDSLLAAGGQLDLTRGGPELEEEQGEQVFRRSLYFRHAYEKQMTMLTTFDAANPTDCYRRSTSIVPQQALALANSQLSLTMARGLESKLAETSPELKDSEFITRTFAILLGRAPESREVDACLAFLSEQTRLLADPSRLSAIGGLGEARAEPASAPNRRARQNLVHTLMNHNDFVTVR